MASISTQLQDIYPPRVLISVTGLVLGNSVELYRVVGGIRTLIRAGVAESVTDTAFLRTDSEMPFGKPVSYLAVINGSTEISTSPATYSIEENPVLSDAITGDAAEVLVNAWDEKTWNPETTVLKQGGRNVVISGPLGMWEASIEFLLLTDTAVANFLDLVRNATQNTLQLRNQRGSWNYYINITGLRERRYSQKETDPRYYFVAEVVEVDAWAPALEATSFTLLDISNKYATLFDLSSAYPTLLAVAQGDYS